MPITLEVVAFRIDQNLLAGIARASNHFVDMRESALGVVGEDDDVGHRDARIELRTLGLQRFGRRRILEVDAQQLLLATDHAQLDRRVHVAVAGKLRMAAELLLPRRNGNSDESLASFVRRRLGQEALERMAQPMVGGIYTADPETLSLRATLPRFLDMERDHRSLILAMMRQGRAQKSGTSGARYSLFLSFDRGMEVLIDALGGVVPNVRLKTRIEALSFNSRTWRMSTDSGETLEADAVCLAVPAYTAARLLEDVSPELASQLNTIKYASTATINLAYPRTFVKHPLNGFGFVVPFIEKRSLLACTFSNVKFAGRAPDDHVLLRAFAGGALQPEMFDDPGTRIEKDLSELLGIKGKPLFTQMAKWERSMPQYEVGHLERVERIESEVKQLRGLALAGNAYRGAGIPDCIRSGETAAETLFNYAA